MEHGHVHEPMVLAAFEEKTNYKITPAGLFVHKTEGFLAASPDGIVTFPGGGRAILEVKCPLTAKDVSMDWLERNKCVFLDNKNSIHLKRNHNYFYQVQIQLECCDLDLGFFVVYFGKGDIHIEKINRDKNFWQQKMFPKLHKFYMEALFPEIVDGRVPRNMAIHEPFLGKSTDK